MHVRWLSSGSQQAAQDEEDDLSVKVSAPACAFVPHSSFLGRAALQTKQ
jgi:hypothetical protein